MSFGDFAVGFGVDDRDTVFELGTDFLQVCADLVAVFCVIHHDEEHGFFAELFVFGVALAPFLDAEGEIVGVFFRDQRAGVFAQAGATFGIG